MINKIFSSSTNKNIKATNIAAFNFFKKQISFISLIIFLPLFISISLETNNFISLDRSVWLPGEFLGTAGNRHASLDMTPYLVSFPFSLILVFLFAIKFFSKIIVNKSYQLTIGWILFILIINFIFGKY